MKNLKILGLAAAFALAGTAVSQAQTNYIRLTGATAPRAQAISAITNMMGATRQVAYKSSTASGSTKANEIVLGGTINGNYCIVKANWSGSAAGIQRVSESIPVAFMADSNLPPAGTETNMASPAYDAAVAADACFSDVEQATTPFTANPLDPSPTYPSVGVITFVWVCSTNAPAGLTNITPQLAQANWVGTGTLPASLYTGDPAHSSINVKATGRDPDSGTRLTSLAESGIGVNTQVRQFDINSGALYTQQVVNGITFVTGNGGEASGGTLANKISTASTNNLGPYITYVGKADAAGKVLRELSYTGVPYSTNAIKEGKYTFWGYERLYYKPGFSGTSFDTMELVAAAVAAQTIDIPLDHMNVERGTDGATIYHK